MPISNTSSLIPGRVFVTVLLMLVSCPFANAEVKRKDVVIMKNGDHLTGEVKKLENGVLYVTTDYFSGSIGLDWSQVERIESTAAFQVTLKNGQRAVGTIEKLPLKDALGSDFRVRAQGAETQSSALDVVSIEPQQSGFWRQLTGSADFGYDFTSGNSQTSLASSASANYLGTKWLGGATFTSSFSGQSGGSKTDTVEVQTLDGLFVSPKSFLMGLGDFLHSSQQNLTLRTTLGAGYGHYWLHTNHNTFAWVAGVAYTHEKFEPVAGQSTDQNVEALLGAQYELFRFNRYGLQSMSLVYPGLSDAGRIRLTTKTTFTVKLTGNFHTDLSFWDNFDSRPPFNSKRNDLGISDSFGWTF